MSNEEKFKQFCEIFKPQFEYEHLPTESARAFGKLFYDAANIVFAGYAECWNLCGAWNTSIWARIIYRMETIYLLNFYYQPANNYDVFLIRKKLTHKLSDFLNLADANRNPNYKEQMFELGFESYEYQIMQLLVEAKNICIKIDIVSEPKDSMNIFGR